MKNSILMSIALSSFAFIGTLRADLMNVPMSLDNCLSTAQDQPSIDRCYGLSSCVENSSAGGAQGLNECILGIEATYAQAGSDLSSIPSSQSSVTSSAVTDVADSAYDNWQTEGGGWKFSHQGD